MRHDLLVLADVPWTAAGGRAHPLLTRAARDRFVFYWEPPVEDDGAPRLELVPGDDGVMIATPHLPAGLSPDDADAAQRALIDDLLATQRLARPVLWYTAAWPLGFARHVRARAVVYDCAAEPGAGAPPAAIDRDELLARRADVVFAPGHALAERLRPRAPNLHVALPGLDVERFARARGGIGPIDLEHLPRPRVGVPVRIDGRVDLALIGELAARRPEVTFVVLGAIVGDPARLPHAPNLRWLGARDDAARPAYLSALDAVVLPYRRDDTTELFAPAEALEAIAVGLPVIATPLRDVVRPYGELGLARLATCAATAAVALDEALAEDPLARLARADAHAAERTWDATWTAMWRTVEAAIRMRTSGVMATIGGGAVTGATAQAEPIRR